MGRFIIVYIHIYYRVLYIKLYLLYSILHINCQISRTKFYGYTPVSSAPPPSPTLEIGHAVSMFSIYIYYYQIFNYHPKIRYDTYAPINVHPEGAMGGDFDNLKNWSNSTPQALCLPTKTFFANIHTV
jgi:hypothetical protein